MGRNWHTKFGEWSDGEKHEIVADREHYPKPDDGKFVVYTRTVRNPKSGEEETATLACAWADGIKELLASFWHSGFEKGRQAGREEALREVRAALGINQ